MLELLLGVGCFTKRRSFLVNLDTFFISDLIFVSYCFLTDLHYIQELYKVYGSLFILDKVVTGYLLGLGGTTVFLLSYK